MASRFRVLVLALAGLTLALLSLQALVARPREASAPSIAPAGAIADTPTGAGSALLTRPPARFRPPADGGPAPWSSGLREIRVGPEGQALRVALPPGPEAGSAEARLLAGERASLDQANAGGPVPVTATILVLPVEYAGSATLDYQVHSPDLSQCITVTERFTGPLHGAIPYPGGSPDATIDNQTVYYPSTEPADYAQLIFGQRGYTEPIRAGDPNVNDGAGVDISGLTVENYFQAQSDGHVVITGTVAPWVALDHPEAYYGIDYCIPNVTPRAIPDEQLGSLAEMTVAAAEKLKTLDPAYAEYGFWRNLDADDDGYVDSLWVMHAGRGQEYGGGSEGEASIWSRSANIAAYDDYAGGHVIHDGGTPDDPADDIRLGAFTLMPEDSDIGVLVEEFGHSYFGFPDLYTNDSANSVGWWAPMSSGIWGGELGGVRPVNMPLWFRMTADCGGRPCGWADPVAVLSYTTPGETIVLGQAGSPTGGQVEDPTSPFFGQTVHEGLRVELPIQVESVPNPAGANGGAYTGAGSGNTLSLGRTLDLERLPAGEGPVLQLASVWNIPRYWGYFFVEVDPDGDGEYQSLPDLDGHFSDENPFGLNDGWGLTGPGPGSEPSHLRFDLSAWRGQRLPLRLRYITYRGGPGTGVWLDDAELHIEELGQDLRFPIDDFDAGLDDWVNSGWGTTPYTLRHPQHYLVEWRNAQGWDRSLLGAYQTSYHDEDEWRVDRAPANLPGALVMYRNLKYPFSGALNPQLADPPSWGAKYGLLVVDPNFRPVERPSGGPFSGALQSLDAALTLPGTRQPDYRLEWRDPATKAVSATDTIQGQLGRSRFDDALGYAPGLRLGADGRPAPWDADGSVVLPSLEGRVYSTRVVDADGAPATDQYGRTYAGIHRLGSGNPGDDNAQFGLRIEVVGQAEDGSWGAVRVYNAAMDYRLTADRETLAPGETVNLEALMSNRGAVASPRISVSLEARIDGRTFHDAPLGPPTELAVGATLTRTASVTLPADPPSAAGARVELIARFDDGDQVWERRLLLALTAPPRLYLPALLDRSGIEVP